MSRAIRPARLSSATFFFNHTATTEIYTLSLHDALPISEAHGFGIVREYVGHGVGRDMHEEPQVPKDRKSTRLNSSHLGISYAVFCLKKKKKVGHGRRHESSIGRVRKRPETPRPETRSRT